LENRADGGARRTLALPIWHAITVLVVLNDDCAGGETAFLDHDVRIRPERGMALLFQHAMRHQGRPITRGRKYVLRSDVRYRPSNRQMIG
jgi:hypothetical protein